MKAEGTEAKKTVLVGYLKVFILDRYLLTLIVFLLLVSVCFAVNICLAIKPADLQTVSHYSAFGTINRYRDQWYYPYLFAVFELLVASLHSVVAAKLLKTKGHSIAAMMGWSGLAVVILGWLAAQSVLFGTL